jgi:hypothetical protein
MIQQYTRAEIIKDLEEWVEKYSFMYGLLPFAKLCETLEKLKAVTKIQGVRNGRVENDSAQLENTGDRLPAGDLEKGD